MEPIFHTAEVVEKSDERKLQAVFQCPRESCKGFLIGYYYQSGDDFHLSDVIPRKLERHEYDKEIRKLSPNFVEIYNQAFLAEQFQLDQICGPGYRKALEFLIKDYAIFENPSDADNIKKIPLASCIKRYVDDSRIQSTAERAAWLGNDETHYVRKWTDQDVSDLKVLIRLTVNWIENVLLTKQYTSTMPKT